MELPQEAITDAKAQMKDLYSRLDEGSVSFDAFLNKQKEIIATLMAPLDAKLREAFIYEQNARKSGDFGLQRDASDEQYKLRAHMDKIARKIHPPERTRARAYGRAIGRYAEENMSTVRRIAGLLQEDTDDVTETEEARQDTILYKCRCEIENQQKKKELQQRIEQLEKGEELKKLKLQYEKL